MIVNPNKFHRVLFQRKCNRNKQKRKLQIDSEVTKTTGYVTLLGITIDDKPIFDANISNFSKISR